jgi:hypothetical protein
MADNLDPRHLDKRTAERYIRMGLLDEKVWEKHLKSLEDVASKGATVETSIAGQEVDDEDEGEDAGS